MYVCLYVLGELALAQRHNRWIAGCGDDRGRRAGKLKQQNARRTRNLRVSLIVWWIARNRRVVWSLSANALQKTGGTKGKRTNDEKYMKKSTKTKPQSTKNRGKINLGLVRAPKAVSKTRPDALGTAFGRPNDAPNPIWGRPGRAKSGQELSKRLAGAPQTRSKRLRDSSQDARNAVRVTKRSRNGLQIDF